MTIPVQIQLLDAFEARLLNISTVNGYSTTLAKVVRATRKPFSTDDLPALNYWPTSDLVVLRGAGWVERSLMVTMEYYDRERDRPYTDASFELALDIETALARDPVKPSFADPPDLFLGGMVKAMQLESVVPQIGEGQTPWYGVILSYNLLYRVPAGSPATLL